jgi:phosphohistidine phosphatase SixA
LLESLSENDLGGLKLKHLIYLFTLIGAGVAYAEQPSPEKLLPQLHKGGYVLFIRHPQTNPDQADTDPLHLDNVAAQRQLSDQGRAQAKALGEAFRTLKIPVAMVITSKFHRAEEAGKLLDVGKVWPSTDVTEGGLVVSPRENQRRATALRGLLSTAPADGKNLLIVSHKPNLQDAAGKELGDLGEAEVVVFKPLGESKFKVIARVASPEIWSKWAK